MSTIQAETAAPPAGRERGPKGLLFAARPGAYLLIVLAAVLGTSGYSLRKDGLFSCQAAGYASNDYLAYCQATSYGDYDHGAFWFGLEPGATRSAANAEVLFLGNSRLQLGFSTAASAEFFGGISARYFLLGFSHYANIAFEAPLLQRLNPRATVYVINTDRFFQQVESPPAEAVMHDTTAKGHYERKRLAQRVHRWLCGSMSALCRNEYVIFRSRETGSWSVSGGQIMNVPVSYDGRADQDRLKEYVAAGREFLGSLPVRRECVILTLVPYVKTDVETARAVAAALGLTLIAPQPDGLSTFDGGHLDDESAERWSAAFFKAAGPRISQCLTAGAAADNPGPSDVVSR